MESKRFFFRGSHVCTFLIFNEKPRISHPKLDHFNKTVTSNRFQFSIMFNSLFFVSKEMAAKTSQSANKGPEKISAGEKPMAGATSADPSPETVVALASPSNATGSPQSAQSVQPASPASPMSPISPQKKAVRRGKEMKETIETPKTPQKTPKASPKRVVPKKKAPVLQVGKRGKGLVGWE